jgi:hypothetical protein
MTPTVRHRLFLFRGRAGAAGGPPQQHRQLRDVGGDAPGLVAGQERLGINVTLLRGEDDFPILLGRLRPPVDNR